MAVDDQKKSMTRFFITYVSLGAERITRKLKLSAYTYAGSSSMYETENACPWSQIRRNALKVHCSQFLTINLRPVSYIISLIIAKLIVAEYMI